MKDNTKDPFNYYTGSNIVNGLKECIYYINEVNPNEKSKYINELLNCLNDTINQINNIQNERL